ncbi:MAG TPA: aminotransferase class V-fold PLP-dependent enzyme [Mycobacteriales bacterium]|jgi:isopenicillin-N epimerase|nr:aminotransferase class V-fold PLP-dependent enzyme [Mycobacteriales bacterium]
MALPPTEWLIDPGTAYLNHGGFGALPVPVARAADVLRREVEANPTDLFMHAWQGRVDEVRSRVATLLHARTDDLVFVPNATTGSATVLSSFPLAAGDEIVVTDHRYPAVRSQVDVQAERRGVVVREVHVPVDVTTAEEIRDRILAQVTDRTRLVVLDHIASATGFRFPVESLVPAIHDAGLPVLVDGAHAPGQVDVDLEALGADFWSGNMHKWVCSPRACAALRVAPRWRDVVRPLVASHEYSHGYQPAFDWTGTLDPIPLLAVPAALDFWESLGWDAVRAEQRRLVNDGARLAAERIGTRVAVADEFTASMRLVELPRPIEFVDGLALMHRLTTEHKVTAYMTHHAGSSYVRICGQLYNSPDDYDRLADALVRELRQ